jgi:hypothetical protein
MSVATMPQSTETQKQIPARHGWAWIGLSTALAVHVTDEALTDFLSIYNPTVAALRERYSFLPLPTFTFEGWLTGLILAIVILLALSPLAFRRARWSVILSYPFGGLMLLNGMMHIAGSIYLGRLMPGVYSAPLLLIASTYLLLSTRRQ